MDLTELTDDTLLRFYEDLHKHVADDVSSGGHQFLGQDTKDRVNLLLAEVERRGLRVIPIDWPPVN
jgi:hypothetical protein